MSINEIGDILRKERAPREKALNSAKAVYEKKVADAKKQAEAAKTAYETKLAEIQKTVQVAKDELTKAETSLKDFDNEVTNWQQGSGNGKAAAAPKGKPGPKPGAKAAAGNKQGPKGKPGPKPGAKANKALAAPKADAKPVASRPPIREALRLILGRKTLASKAIVAEMGARNWIDKDWSNPSSYISYALSSNKDWFETTARGVYRVKDGAPAISAAVKARFGNVVSTASTETTAAPSKDATTKAPKKAAAATTKTTSKAGKKQHACKVCNTPGHNAKGHTKWAAKQAAPTATKAASTPAPEPKPVAATPAANKVTRTVDDILAAEATASSGLPPEAHAAFG